ncbi:MAG: nucleoside deaminase [Caldilineaceae bacterium]
MKIGKTIMEITLTMPDWAVQELAQLPTHFPTVEERMAAVIRFSRLNFEHNTGGPFAAGVFERDSGKLVVIGVNRVMATNCSSAHAEIMTLSLAQKMLGAYDLGGPGQPVHQLVVNWRPCAMCFGAVLWSGVRSLVIAGNGPELEAFTGFDEGPVHPDWEKELNARGIEVINNVLRAEACQVFRAFGESDRFVYNARQGA